MYIIQNDNDEDSLATSVSMSWLLYLEENVLGELMAITSSSMCIESDCFNNRILYFCGM